MKDVNDAKIRIQKINAKEHKGKENARVFTKKPRYTDVKGITHALVFWFFYNTINFSFLSFSF